MKIRRRFATGGPLGRFVATLRDRLGLEPASEGAERGGPDRWEPDDAPAPHPEWQARRRFLVIAAGVFAATLLGGYLLAALAFFPAPIFATSRSVPRLLGLSEEAATERLAAAGLGLGAVERAPHPSAEGGRVIWQDPPPEVVTLEGSEVRLTVSTGPQRIPVPDVAGYEAAHARILLEGAGLSVGSVESTQAPTPKNVAVNTRPPAGTPLTPGTRVTLVVSVGAATIRVPSLVGMTEEEARRALEAAGLVLGTSFSQLTTATAPGEVFYQNPGAGTLSAPGRAVDVRVARGSQ